MAISKAQIKATAKYQKNNYDEIKLRTAKGQKEQIKAAADAAGQSVNAYILEAVEQRMKDKK